MLKTCEFCGKEYEAYRSNQKFCSVSCKNKQRYRKRIKKIRICEICGKKFMPNVYNQKYCSTRCEVEAVSRRQKTRYRENPEPQREYNRKYAAMKREQRKVGKVIPAKEKPLDKWIQEAAECGLSYGKYRALVEKFGKTFEELKAAYVGGD